MTTKLKHACEECQGSGHSEFGVWDCDECIGTGIGDADVRNACLILTAAARSTSVTDVSSADVHRFWEAIR